MQTDLSRYFEINLLVKRGQDEKLLRDIALVDVKIAGFRNMQDASIFIFPFLFAFFLICLYFLAYWLIISSVLVDLA